jgi:hypothetical protein
MQTVLVEIDNQKAMNLLQELEDLHVLRIVKGSVSENKAKLSDKYRGVFSKEDAKDFMEHTQTVRKEWGNI